MDRWVGKTALVTGASAGIGAAIAVSLADRGLVVVGAARRHQLVEELKSQIKGSGCIVARRCDVSNPQDVDQLFDWIERTHGGVDVLVNNAGFISHGNIVDGPYAVPVADLMQVVDVNVKSVVLCSRLAAMSMKKREVAGHIININSVIGHYVSKQPHFNVYCASKHAVTAFTESLRNEFTSLGLDIKITSLSPGLVDTQMANIDRIPELVPLLARARKLRAQDIADAALYVLATPPLINIDELTITPVGKARI